MASVSLLVSGLSSSLSPLNSTFLSISMMRQELLLIRLQGGTGARSFMESSIESRPTKNSKEELQLPIFSSHYLTPYLVKEKTTPRMLQL